MIRDIIIFSFVLCLKFNETWQKPNYISDQETMAQIAIDELLYNDNPKINNPLPDYINLKEIQSMPSETTRNLERKPKTSNYEEQKIPSQILNYINDQKIKLQELNDIAIQEINAKLSSFTEDDKTKAFIPKNYKVITQLSNNSNENQQINSPKRQNINTYMTNYVNNRESNNISSNTDEHEIKTQEINLNYNQSMKAHTQNYIEGKEHIIIEEEGMSAYGNEEGNGSDGMIVTRTCVGCKQLINESEYSKPLYFRMVVAALKQYDKENHYIIRIKKIEEQIVKGKKYYITFRMTYCTELDDKCWTHVCNTEIVDNDVLCIECTKTIPQE